MKVAPLVGAWIEIYVDLDAAKDGYGVAPLVGAWIEIDHKGYYCSTCAVAPLVGAWIEICWDNIHVHPPARSLPSWERGLKYTSLLRRQRSIRSLPSWERGLKSYPIGAPLGASVSLPSWERGLKYVI